MSDLLKKISHLSSSQQQLLLRRLHQEQSNILPAPPDTLLPLSFAQQRLWFLQQLDNTSTAYNLAGTLRLQGKLQISALAASLEQIVDRHVILRTNICNRDGQPLLQVQPTSDWQMQIVDLRAEDVQTQQATSEQLLQSETDYPFDLATDLLLRVTLVIRAEDDYLLIFCMHHIVSDGWSMGIFVQELATCYPAQVNHQPPVLPLLPIQYQDFAYWQRQWLAGGVQQKQLQYWRQQLAGIPALLDLPTDRMRPAVQTFHGQQQSFEIDLALTQQLETWSKDQACTIFMTLLTAFKILLYRYSNQTDLPIGTPVANRNRREVENLIGFFVNTLVLRSDLSGNPTVTELLIKVRNTALEAYAHQDLPFELLVEDLQPTRDLSHTPLFQVMFVLQNAPEAELSLAGINLSSYQPPTQTAKFDLTLSIEQNTQGLIGTWEYNTDLFDSQTIEHLSAHWHQILIGMVATPTQTISQLPLAPLWPAQPPSALPSFSSEFLPDLVAQQAAKTPNALALGGEGQYLTYHTLNSRANQLAHYLQSIGLQPGMTVGLSLHRAPQMVVAILGILKAGGVYVPLDPDYPAQRLEFALTDSSITILVTEQAVVDRSSMVWSTCSQLQVVCLDKNSDRIAQASTADMPSPVTKQDLAYILYTSGSTGQPKGVMIDHCALATHCQVMANQLQLTAADRVLQFASLNFDPSLEQIFTTLITGGQLLVRGATLWTPNELLAQIHRHQLTVINLPTAYWEQVVAAWQAQPSIDLSLTSLRLLIVGGASLSPNYIDRWQQLGLNSIRLFNAYGPTEATITATLFEVPSLGQGQSISIGLPLPGRTAQVLDRYLQPQPIGFPGELFLGGLGIAQGYLNRPDLTARNFIVDPQNSASRLYRTGDLARCLANGQIEYLGRIDRQVKIRGCRVELTEVEFVLLQYPAVTQAVAIVADERLVAYVVAPTTVSTSDLRKFCQERLPDYMCPAAFGQIPAIPLTSNGKIDLSNLPQPTYQRTNDFVAPHTPIEQTLAEIWSSLLNVEQIGIHDNFFALGGDSILSLQIVARAQAVGLQLTPKLLFSHQSIGELAPYIQTATINTAPQGEVTGFVAPTPIQQWFWQENLPKPHHFNQSILLKVPADLQVDLLQQVLQALLHHHDALRLCYTPGDRQQSQAPQTTTVPLQIHDLRGLSVEAQTSQIAQIGDARQRSINLATGPLLLANLFQLEDSGRLQIVIHHLAIDGVSWRILLADLWTAYQQCAAGIKIQLPAKTTSWQDWAAKLTNYAQTITPEIAYWQTIASHANRALPLDFPQGQNTCGTTATISQVLDTTATHHLLQVVPQVYHTQVNDVLLTALTQALQQWTGHQTLITLEGHGRADLFADVDLSRTVGWFTTMFPICLQLPTSEDLGQQLLAIKEQLRAIPQQGIGYGLLRYLHHDPALTAQLATIAPEISFNYLGQFDQTLATTAEWDIATEFAGVDRSPHGQRPCLIEINCLMVAGQLHLNWTYSEALHQATTIQSLATDMLERLQQLIDHCLQPTAGGYSPSDFPLAQLTDRELAQALHHAGDWRQVADIYPLSPMQQGMLFHSLAAPNTDVYIEQLTCTLNGALQINAFSQAWQQLIDRHAVLRTGYLWSGYAQPLQIVYHQVAPPLTVLDWRSIDPATQQQQLAALLTTPIDIPLDQPPLLRLTLIQMADDRHQMLWQHHHLLLDGWSMPLVFQELLATYSAIEQEQQSNLAPVLPYRHYISWLQQQDQAAAATFWQQKLHDWSAPTPLPITAEIDRSPITATDFQEQALYLDLAVTQNLQTFARTHHFTINNLIQGAWALLLARYSGEAEVVFGATVAGRPPALPGVEAMVGLFINTLPVRIAISPDLTVLPWLKSIQNQQVESEQYAYSSLVEIQGWSNVPRSLSLFESIVVFENYPIGAAVQDQPGDLTITDIHSREQTHYPLTLLVAPAEQLALKLSYDSKYFNTATIEQLLQHFATILTNLITQPDRQVAHIALLSNDQQQQIWMQPQATSALPTGTVVDWVSQQAKLTPQAIAVIDGDLQLTYQGLIDRAEQLAQYLISIGVQPNLPVGICAERSASMVIGVLAILLAGGAYLPLDSSYPLDRLHLMVTNAEVSILLTSAQLAPQFTDLNLQIVDLNQPLDRSTIVLPTTDLNHLGYVIYTSGSTGQPKGIAMPHRALSNLIHWQCRQSGDIGVGRTLQFSPISFDVSFQEIFATWCAGGTLVLITEDLRRDPLALLATIHQQQIDRLFLPVVALQQLAAAQSAQPTIPTQLQEVIVAGEQLQITPAIKQFFSHIPHCTLHNHYGPSESHVVTAFTLSGAAHDWPTLPPIGKPLPNTTVYILDEQLQPLPSGLPGELYLGGDCLAQGYLHRPGLTADRFIDHPHQPQAKLYRTGDLARSLPNGDIIYLGRIDDQVKMRGFRVELGEIAAVLTQHPAIQQAAVVLHLDSSGDRRLVAYTAPQHELSPLELRSFLQARLPEYMVPAAYLTLKALPLTPSGKVDRRALPAPDFQRLATAPLVAARNEREELLTAIWTAVLGIDRLGIHDNFFDLGGHSLQATQVISRVRSTWTVEIPVSSLFTAPTIAELSTVIQAALPTAAPPLTARQQVDLLPLSFAQQRLWFLDQLQPESAAYNIPIAMRLVGDLDLDLLEQSFQQIVQRHEVLRTNFVTISGQPQQIVYPDRSKQWSVIDLSAANSSNTDQDVEHLMGELATKPFDLTTDSLWRVTVLKCSPTNHILLIVLHHIISDGWSLGILTNELATIYQASVQKQPLTLADLPVQYADFAIWQRQWLQAEELTTQLNYWQQQLAAAPSRLELPTDRPRPAIQTSNGAHYSFAIPATVSSALVELSQQQGVTPFMTLLAAFNVLLYRSSNQTDILVGSPIANRNRQELEGLIGFFVNTLVWRTKLSGDLSFVHLLAQVRETSLGAYAHQDLPFEMLVEALQPERDLSYTPLFQVMLVLQNAPTTDLAITSELQIQPLGLANTIATFDLTLTLVQTEAGLDADWEYNTDLFDASTIQRWAEHFQTLLVSIVANPHQEIDRLSLLTPVAQQQLIQDWNNTQADYPTDHYIHELFEAQVAQSPEAIAVICGDQQLTYHQLNARANQLAHYLQQQGVTADSLVGLCLERSIDLIVSLWGILKAGGAYLPLDPAYPSARLEQMLVASQATYLLTTSKLRDTLPATEAQIICLDEISLQLHSHSTVNLVSSLTPADLAYVIFTSGSTGIPKGVMITQQNLVHFCWAATQAYSITPLDRVLQFSSISFDVSVEEIFPTLTQGATLYLRPAEMIDSEAQFWAHCDRAQLTVLDLPTAYWQQLTAELTNSTIPPSVRLVIIGGEKVLPQQVRLWQAQVGAYPLLMNAYGPTETTVEATVCLLSGHPLTSPEVPIGRPLANVQTYVLDSRQQPVPIGILGELYIGGAGVARGYLHQPKLTAERFVTHPFIPHERLYRTGDLVRYLPDGQIEYFGRLDEQIKIRGFRVELSEIENLLCQHPTVQQAVVVLHTDPTPKLVAYLVGDIDNNHLRAFLQARLPEYMVPALLMSLPQLPLTPSGKIDRRALPAPTLDRSNREIVSPHTPIEQSLAKIWSGLLGFDQLSIYDNFFELGGHSLLATQVIARLQQELAVTIPLRTLFAAPTIAQLAEAIQQAIPSNAIPLLPRDMADSIPLSFSQQRLWFLDQLQPQSSAYNMFTAVRLTGQLNLAALHHALASVVQRHESLRTNFVVVDNQPLQVVHPNKSWSLASIDLRHLSIDQQEAQIQQLATTAAQCPFNLATDWLLRATLIHCRDQHVLMLTLHHIISDGWSMGVLIQELAAYYDAYYVGEYSPLPNLSIQYPDFALWQRQWLQGAVLDRQLNYWRTQLADAPTLLTLPTDRPRPAIQTDHGATHHFQIPATVSQKLEALSQQVGGTLFMTLLAAFNVLLYRYSGQSDILVGSPIANRQQQVTESLIGFFVNTLVLRTDLSGDPSFKELLERVKEVSLAAYSHQDLPFEMLIETLQPARDLSHTPLFQVMFILQNTPVVAIDLTDDLHLQPLPVDQVTANFDLTLSIEPSPEGLEAEWEYNTDLFEATTIQRLTGHFQQLLTCIVTNPDQSIEYLSLLTTAEKQILLHQWNDTTTTYPVLCMHELFAQQVVRNPQAIAVVYGEDQLTYQELHLKSNQLARHLRMLGVGPEVIVGISVERSLEMVIGILGILKAGGAYLPLDPAYPRDRLDLMLVNSQAQVILTQTALLNNLPNLQVPIVLLDQDWPEIACWSNANLPATVEPHHLAYLIFTSGSTGTPKGVMVEHRNLVNAFFAWAEDYRLHRCTSHLQMASFSFDVFAGDLVRALCSGGKLVICPTATLLAADQLYHLLRTAAVDCAEFVPAVFRNLAQYLEETGQNLHFMRLVILGSDSWYVQEYQQFQRLLRPQARLINSYGVSESTIDSTYFETTEIEKFGDGLVPIGRPFANTQVYLLDRHLQPVPIGVPGEIYLGGAGVGRGYWQRPDLTNDRFIGNPFSTLASAKLYKTGDRGIYLADGNLKYLERSDQQIKIRGFRIELGEIETVLQQHPAIYQSIIIGLTDRPGLQQLVAYIVAADDQQISKADLRTHMRSKLPDYMIPAAFVQLPSLPLTPNGKLDRRALPVPDSHSYTDDRLFIPPADHIEQQLTEIWSTVLQVYPISTHDDFFDLGGHSLLAVHLMAKIEQQFSQKLPLASLFQYPTISQLATRLREPHQSDVWSPLIALQPRGTQPTFFCVPGAGGNPIYLHQLAHYLGSDQPCYALQSLGLDGNSTPHQTVEEMATAYIQAIQSHQPQGPYYLGGHSFGGLVAFEIANQLHQQGEKVAFLGIIDSSAPHQQITTTATEADWWQEIALILEQLYGRSLDVSIEMLSTLTPNAQLEYFLSRLQDAQLFPEASTEQLRALIQVYRNEVLMVYQPQHLYPQQITCFVSSEAEDGTSNLPTDDLGWQEFTTLAPVIQPVPGNHFTMLTHPHVEILAHQIRTAIATSTLI